MSLEYNPSIDIIFGPMYSGKCLGKGTPIIMFDGSIKKVENIVQGDIIMGNDSSKRTILSTTKGVGMLYKINQEFGDSYVVNEDHILSLVCPYTQKVVNISVSDYLNTDRYKEYKGYISKVEFSEKEVDIDPYVLGVWIGDNMADENISDKEFIRRLEIFEKFVTTEKMSYFNTFERSIPLKYKTNSLNVRMDIFKGLLERSGLWCDKKRMYRFKQKTDILVCDIVYLCRSLGFLTQVEICENYYYIYVDMLKNTNSITVEKIGNGDYYGFTLDGNGLFLLGDFTVTHNTSEVIRRLIIYHEIGMKVLYLNTDLDNRAEEAFSTHNETIGKVPFDSVKVKKLKNTDIDKYDVIAIDEAQFFGDLKENVLEWVENKKKIVIIAGLNGDFRRCPFGQLNEMVPYADTITKLSPFCSDCIKKEKKMKLALFTKRIVENNCEILIGGKELYIPVCRECYNK